MTDRRQLLLVALLVSAAGLIYLPTLRYEFTWDDQMLITENRNLRTANPAQLFAQTFWPDPTGEGYYRPVVALSYWVERRLWGLNPLGFHLTNLLLNCLVAGLAALVLARLLGKALLALVGGLLFALHPAHVESVAFVSGRTDLLMSVFLLTAFLLVLRFRATQRPITGIGILAGFSLALLCKEAAIMFPLLAFLALAPSIRRPGTTRQTWFLLIGMILIAALYLVARSLILSGKTAGWSEETPVQRVFLVVNGFGRYLYQAVWPFGHRLLFSDVEAFAAFGWPTLVGLVGFSGLVWLAWRYRGQALGLGSTLFILFVLPGCNLFPIGLTYFAERLLYLPVLGLVILGAAAAAHVPGPGLRRLLLIAAIIYASAMAWGTLRRMPVWQNNATLYAKMVQEAPDSPNAHYNWGTELDRRGDIPGAMAAYRRALEASPDFAPAYNNLGVLLERTGDRAGAYLAYRRAMGLDSTYATVRYNYAGALKSSGDLAGATRELRRALELQPFLTQARRQLARLYLDMENISAAVEEYRVGLALEPDDASLHYGLAAALRASGNLTAAIQEYGRAIELDPTMVAAHNDQAIALEEAGNPEAALRGFKRAAELAPNDPYVHANLAAMLERMGHHEQAETVYQRVLELAPDFSLPKNSRGKP